MLIASDDKRNEIFSQAQALSSLSWYKPPCLLVDGRNERCLIYDGSASVRRWTKTKWVWFSRSEKQHNLIVIVEWRPWQPWPQEGKKNSGMNVLFCIQGSQPLGFKTDPYDVKLLPTNQPPEHVGCLELRYQPDRLAIKDAQDGKYLQLTGRWKRNDLTPTSFFGCECWFYSMILPYLAPR